MERYDLIIAGGGLNGPLLALALAQSGLDVAVIDAAPDRARSLPGFDGRAYAMALASQRVLAALGIWGQLAPDSQPILSVKAAQGLEGEAADPFNLHFDSAEIEEGPVGWMVEDRHLALALLEAMDAAGIKRLPATQIVDHQVTTGHVEATTDTGMRLQAALLVAADGRRSATASRAGIKRRGWGYGQTAIVATIGHELPHDGVAHQLFFPGGPLAILPLTGNRSNLVWSLPDNEAAGMQALDDRDFLDILAPRFGDFMGGLSLEGRRFAYPLSMSLADEYIAPRLALTGDAAHGVHPIAGQGLNLGIRDVAALAETVSDSHRRGEDIGAISVLTRYQEWRRFDATMMALGMDMANKLFSNPDPLLRTARGLGMGLIQATPPLRRLFMRQAAGLARPGPMPKLMTGRPL